MKETIKLEVKYLENNSKEILFTKFKIYNNKDYLGTVLKENTVRRLLNEYNDLSAKKVIKYNDDSIETLSYSLSLF